MGTERTLSRNNQRQPFIAEQRHPQIRIIENMINYYHWLAPDIVSCPLGYAQVLVVKPEAGK
jgi:hypothetical protein